MDDTLWMDDTYWISVIVVSLTCGVLGAVMGAQKNAQLIGWFLGFLLGPLGVIAILAIDRRSQCPKCKGRYDDGAQVCPHCGSDLLMGRGDQRGPPPLRSVTPPIRR